MWSSLAFHCRGFNTERESTVADKHSVPLGAARGEGTIRNVNTMETFRTMDKVAILNRAANTVSSRTFCIRIQTCD